MSSAERARYLTWLVIAFLAVLGLAALLWVQNALSAPRPAHRNYHAVTVEQLAAGKVPWPYAQVTGRVRMVRVEQDGDLHIKLTGVTAFIVLECIPELPCEKPPLLVRITAWGIPRPDREHGWEELHPIFKWELAK